MCCAGSCVAPCATATSSARRRRSSPSCCPRSPSVMGEAYPVLREKQSFIRDVLFSEGEQFARTLATGMTLLEEAIANLKGSPQAGWRGGVQAVRHLRLPGRSHGGHRARARTASSTRPASKRAMDAQRDRARAASRFGVDLRGGTDLDAITDFSGYEHVAGESRVVALLKGGVAGRRTGRRRGGRSRAGAHAVLRRVRRTGGRYGRTGGGQGARLP